MSEVKIVGSLESKFESTNRIYDVGGCSPTLSTMQGGNQEPKILVNQLGFMDNGTGKHQSNTVYSENGLSPLTSQRLRAVVHSRLRLQKVR